MLGDLGHMNSNCKVKKIILNSLWCKKRGWILILSNTFSNTDKY